MIKRISQTASGLQNSMICQPYHCPFADTARNWVLNRLTRRLVEYAKYFTGTSIHCVRGRPYSHRLCDWFYAPDAAFPIGFLNLVADSPEDPFRQVFLLFCAPPLF